MNIDINIERKLEMALPIDAVGDMVLDDLEATLRRFPKLRRLTRLAEREYLWDMDVIGSRAAKVAHEVVYAARYTVDERQREIRFKPMPEHGNASLEGRIRVIDHGATTQLVFEVRGRLREVPVPIMYRLLAPGFIQGKFTRLVDTFLESTRDAASAPRPRRRKAAVNAAHSR